MAGREAFERVPLAFSIFRSGVIAVGLRYKNRGGAPEKRVLSCMV
jgi:hypothetical protein